MIYRLFKATQPQNSILLIILASLLASLGSLGLLITRFAYSGRLLYAFLIWNLFLAWIPFLLSLLANKFQKRPLLFILIALFWLLFFPNALYLITDLIHLRPTGIIPVWYDAVMLLSFALTGLFLGFTSLYMIQRLINQWFGQGCGWFFAVSLLGVSSFGVYIGRFLRWNSWDVFTRPTALLADIFNNLLTPHLMLKSLTISIFLALLFTFAYINLFWLSAVSYQFFARKSSRLTTDNYFQEATL